MRLSLICCAAVGFACPIFPSPAAQQKVDFAKQVQPILAKYCYECHGPEKQKAGLRLDQKDAALKGGESGPLLIPGNSSQSLLTLAITGGKEDLARMPKKRDPLSTVEIS